MCIHMFHIYVLEEFGFKIVLNISSSSTTTILDCVHTLRKEKERMANL